MRPIFLMLLSLVAARDAVAQIAPANAAGVAMGHLHFFVDDIEVNRDFWLALGGTGGGTVAGGSEIVVMPGVLILIDERVAGRDSSILDHVAFRVESLAAIERRGFELERLEAFPGIASVYAPSGDRIELFEEGTATNVGFDADIADDVAERHNRPLSQPIDSHHLHFYLPEAEVLEARDWYVTHFGAVPGTRWRYAAADLPGMNLNFSATSPARSGTRAQSLDHIGLEIEDIEAFCERLASRGVVFDLPLTVAASPGAVRRAVLTDPWGTTIELTEGLRR